MTLQSVIATHCPDLRHVTWLPDAELAERAIVQAAESAAIDAKEGMYTEDEYETGTSDAVLAERDRIKDELYHILNDVEWSRAKELAGLIRKALDDL